MTEQEPFYIPSRALVVFAHCDDIEFGVSGTVARWTDAGAHVTYAIMTDSSAGSNEPGADLDLLKRTRRQEQIDAAAIVGVEDMRFFDDYKDGALVPSLALREDITRLIREVRPDVVMTFDPETVFAAERGYINHPDHRAVAEATLYAVFPSAGSRPIFPGLLEEGYEPHNVKHLYMTLTNHVNLYTDITPTIEKKAAALRCHPSQFDEEVVEMVMDWNQEAGKEAGVEYAETFRTLTLRHGEPEDEQA